VKLLLLVAACRLLKLGAFFENLFEAFFVEGFLELGDVSGCFARVFFFLRP
jgi:hypothetical protein